MDKWRERAGTMVREQLIARGISSSRVLEAMGSVPRHLFVPEDFRESAWIDSPLPIGFDQTISQPYMVARMTELLDPREGERILEIGTGSGYQAAVLAAMGARVTSLERIRRLAESARENLGNAGLDAEVIWSDGGEESRPQGPFDGVIVTAAAPELELWWTDVLSAEGRLVVPLSVVSGTERLLVRKATGPGEFKDQWHDYCRFVPLLKGLQDFKGTHE